MVDKDSYQMKVDPDLVLYPIVFLYRNNDSLKIKV